MNQKKMVKLSIFASILLAFPMINVSAMHIMEGFLPLKWCIAWGALCIPFVVNGFF